MDKEQELVNAVEKVAQMAAENIFTPEHKTPANLDERRVEGLGCAVSKWAKWDGATIFLVAAAALEDANCPDLAAALREHSLQMMQLRALLEED